MAAKFSNILNRLMGKRLLVWVLTLALIFFFLALFVTVFWNVRMKITYRAEMRVEEISPRCRILVTIPRQSLQLIREGDRAELVPEGMGMMSGQVEKVERTDGSFRLTVLSASAEKGKSYRFKKNGALTGEITLRAVRLLSAFSRRSPPHSASGS